MANVIAISVGVSLKSNAEFVEKTEVLVKTSGLLNKLCVLKKVVAFSSERILRGVAVSISKVVLVSAVLENVSSDAVDMEIISPCSNWLVLSSEVDLVSKTVAVLVVGDISVKIADENSSAKGLAEVGARLELFETE